MNIKMISLMALLTTLTGCAGHRETARPEPAAPPLEAPQAPFSLEPLGCPVYAGDDRPDYDAQALECIVKWMGEAHEYLAKGGKPTKHTSDESFEQYRVTAQKLVARVSRSLTQARPNAAAAPPASGMTARTPSGADASRESQQHYLSGVIFYQKGDLEGARREWLRAKRLDPANSDAEAGLDRLEKTR
ncbi:MAG: hypothetical protein AAB320_01920 [Elusimicrobiota bacterium]